MPPDNLIDGRAIAAQIQRELAARVAELKKRGATPGLAFVCLRFVGKHCYLSKRIDRKSVV